MRNRPGQDSSTAQYHGSEIAWAGATERDERAHRAERPDGRSWLAEPGGSGPERALASRGVRCPCRLLATALRSDSRVWQAGNRRPRAEILPEILPEILAPNASPRRRFGTRRTVWPEAGWWGCDPQQPSPRRCRRSARRRGIDDAPSVWPGEEAAEDRVPALLTLDGR
jgi:hypothetical protein